MNTTAPISGRLFDVLIHREVGQSATVRVLADSPDEATAVALTVGNDAPNWQEDEPNLPWEPDLAGNEPEDVATMVFDPDVDDQRPADEPIYMLREGAAIMMHKPETHQRQPQGVDPLLASLARAASGLVGAYGGDVPDWLRAEVAALDDALDAVRTGQPQALAPLSELLDSLTRGQASFIASALEVGYEGAPDAEVEEATDENMAAAEAFKSRLEQFAQTGCVQPLHLPPVAGRALEMAETAIALLDAEIDQLVQFTRPTFNDDRGIAAAREAGEEAEGAIKAALTLKAAPPFVAEADVDVVLGLAESFASHWESDEGQDAAEQAEADAARATLDRVGDTIRAACAGAMPDVRVVATVEGGQVQGFVTSHPGVKVYSLDYDTEGETDDNLINVPQQGSDDTAEGRFWQDSADVDPQWIRQVACAPTLAEIAKQEAEEEEAERRERGKIACGQCEGTGTTDAMGHDEECPVCDGSGEIDDPDADDEA